MCLPNTGGIVTAGVLGEEITADGSVIENIRVLYIV
jgi:hypothetical protein